MTEKRKKGVRKLSKKRGLFDAVLQKIYIMTSHAFMALSTQKVFLVVLILLNSFSVFCINTHESKENKWFKISHTTIFAYANNYSKRRFACGILSASQKRNETYFRPRAGNT